MDNKKLMQDVLAEKLMKMAGGDFQPEIGMDPNPKSRFGEFIPEIPGKMPQNQMADGLIRYRGPGSIVSGRAIEGKEPKPDMTNPMILQQALDQRKMKMGV